METFSPILLFTYKRLDPLKETVKALKNNYLAQHSDLYIFSDGPKTAADKTQVAAIRAYLRSIDGFQSITINESVTNKGLATSIITGVDQIMQFSDRVIVLEDDLLTTPNFLNFMNNALSHYGKEQKVFSISGFSFDLKLKEASFEDSYFLHRGWSWGWATWRDRWAKVDWQVKDYNTFKTNTKLKKEFALGGSDVNKMLQKQMEGKLDSWAIRWFYHQFKVKGLTLYPVYSKVYNNGFDTYATHTTGSNNRYIPLLDTQNGLDINYPQKIEVRSKYQIPFLGKMGIWARIKSKIESILSK